MHAEGDIRSPLRLQRGFSMPKQEGQPNEDSWWASTDGMICAVSDGASVSFDSGLWAEILVRRFVDNADVCRAWLDVNATEYQSGYDRETMAWMDQAAFDRGSFATLLGLVCSPDGHHASVIAIGDSLFAFVDGNELVRTIPYITPSEFDKSPLLLSTNQLENCSWDDETIAEARHDLNIASHERPTFLLMTDAIGRWVLDQPCGERVSMLLDIKNDEEFVNFVERERAEGRLRRDDATLVVFGGAP
jgi:hypothetical protein